MNRKTEDIYGGEDENKIFLFVGILTPIVLFMIFGFTKIFVFFTFFILSLILPPTLFMFYIRRKYDELKIPLAIVASYVAIWCYFFIDINPHGYGVYNYLILNDLYFKVSGVVMTFLWNYIFSWVWAAIILILSSLGIL